MHKMIRKRPFYLPLFLAAAVCIRTAAAADVGIALSWGTTESNTLLVVSCYSEEELTASDCCSAMTRSVSSLLEEHPEEQSMLESLAKQSVRCEQEGSVVPAIKDGLQVAANLRFIYQASFPKTLTASNQHKLYLWKNGRGDWWQNILEKDDFQKFGLSWAGKDEGPTTSATLQSVLSQSGGMHRSIHHTLSISASADRVETFFFLLVPSDMFMDAEDAFDEHAFQVEGLDRSTYNYTLELQSERVMDIEQPSFTSPQHAVVVRLQWQNLGSTKNEESLTIHFATKIHLRYPAPAMDSNNLYQPVALMPPLLMGGSVDHSGTRTSLSVELERRHLLQYWTDNTVGGGELEFLTTTVASAPQDDFVWVAGLTVLFSVLGAAFLGYEASRIAHE